MRLEVPLSPEGRTLQQTPFHFVNSEHTRSDSLSCLDSSAHVLFGRAHDAGKNLTDVQTNSGTCHIAAIAFATSSYRNPARP